MVPIRNVPVVTPNFAWDDLSAPHVSRSIREALRRFDLLEADAPVALAARWQGSATFKRIREFCGGVIDALLAQPLILVFDSDIGGLLGLHVRDEHPQVNIISIDGVDLREFDYIDIGALIPTSGAVPVVIKSLVFPNTGTL
jgi:ethanolamine utilization protein EutA